MGNIYVYDNNTGSDIPVKVNNSNVELLLGSTISSIKSNIQDDADLFCVITPLNNFDFVVKTELEMRALKKILDFGKYDYKIDIKDKSIWYSDKATTTIIVSSNLNLSSEEFETLLGLYYNCYKEFISLTNPKTKSDMYRVIAVRTNREIIRTPILSEATKNCDQNPGTMVLNRENEVLYRSRFGKVPIPYVPENHTAQHKAKLRDINKRIEIKIK